MNLEERRKKDLFNSMNRFIKVFILLFILIVIGVRDIQAQVEINEFFPDASTEWVELFNASDSAEYLKTYYLDDDTDFSSDAGSKPKKLLSTLNISNFQYPYFEFTTYYLNNDGDWVVLFSPDGTIVDQYQYSSNPGSDISIGRSPDHTGEFTVLSSPTKGSENSAPLATPTSTPTNSPTPTFSPSPTPTPTPKATVTIKPKATAKPTSTVTPQEENVTGETSPQASQGENLVLGLREELNAAVKNATSSEDTQKFPFLAVVFIILGLGIIGFATLTFLRNKKKGYNESDGNETDGEGFERDSQENL